MASLSELVNASEQCFVALCDKYGNSKNALAASLLDISARFTQWSNSIGARQPYHIPTSLEHRVRNATKLQDLFRARLNDLHEDLSDLIQTLNEATVDLLNDVPHITAATTALEDEPDVEPNSLTDITELLKAAGEDISALFKLSAVARKATTRDRYARALARVSSDDVLSKEAEADTIGDQYPTLRFPELQWLRRRLTEANNTRRRFLKYCEDHAEAISKSNNRIESLEKDVENKPAEDRSSSSGPRGIHSDDIAEGGDSATISDQTTASTAHGTLAEITERTAEQITQADTESFISYATQTPTESTLFVPPLETASKGFQVFICPYCQSEQSITSQVAWRRHVLADLRAYACTHESCELRMFENSHAWLKHELSEHFASRRCPYCEGHDVINTGQKLESHLVEKHSGRFRSEQLPQLVSVSVAEPDQISPHACHFCDWPAKLRYVDATFRSNEDSLVSIQRYRRHVGSHLEQVALLTITSSTRDQDLELGSADGGSDDEIHNAEVRINWEKVKPLEGHMGWAWGVAFSPDGRIVASTSMDMTIRLWDVTEGAQIMALEGHKDTVWKVAFSPNGQLLASASSDGSVRLWDVATWEEIKRLERLENSTGLLMRSVAFSPDGQLIAAAVTDGTVQIWDVGAGTEVKRIEGHDCAVYDIAYSPGGRLIATAATDGTTRLWDVATGTEQRCLKGDPSATLIECVAFSPDGQLVASESSDTKIWLWDVGTGQVVKQLEGHKKEINTVVFSLDGQLIASASGDATVRVWNVASGLEIQRLECSGNTAWGVAFSPDGKLIASTSNKGTVQLWDWRTVAGAKSSEKNRSLRDRFQDLFSIRK